MARSAQQAAIGPNRLAVAAMGDMAGGLHPANGVRETLGNVHEVVISVPFPRDAVYKELTSATLPLGLDRGRVGMRVLKNWEDSTQIDTLQIGCIREATFYGNGGTATSELLELEQDRLIKWQELESSFSSTRMVGIGRHKPTFCIQLSDAPIGTRALLRYEFYRIESRGLCGTRLDPMFPTEITSKLGATLRNSWVSDMVQRKYTPLVTPDVPFEDGFEVAFDLNFDIADVWRETVRFSKVGVRPVPTRHSSSQRTQLARTDVKPSTPSSLCWRCAVATAPRPRLPCSHRAAPRRRLLGSLHCHQGRLRARRPGERGLGAQGAVLWRAGGLHALRGGRHARAVLHQVAATREREERHPAAGDRPLATRVLRRSRGARARYQGDGQVRLCEDCRRHDEGHLGVLQGYGGALLGSRDAVAR